MSTQSDQAELVRQAREMYADENLEVDLDAKVSASPGGSWVQAWIWVPAEKETTCNGFSIV